MARSKSSRLNEEFRIIWVHILSENAQSLKAAMLNFRGTEEESSKISITQDALSVLAANGLIHCNIVYKTDKSGKQNENERKRTVVGKAYEAVDTDFNAPTYLSPPT